ncbi:MAG: hypothetical protein JO267_05540 [Alphaproteobacteria bacterium]|nr:hypothetical protein [Alphaproteobacteria bacterium]
MPADYAQQILACAALLLAVAIFRRLSPEVRCALFIILFGCGVLAGIAGWAHQAIWNLFD